MVRLQRALHALVVDVIVPLDFLGQQDKVSLCVPHYVVEDIIIPEKINFIQYNERSTGKHFIASVHYLLHLVSFA